MLNEKTNITNLGFLIALVLTWLIGPGILPLPWSLGITALIAAIGLGVSLWREHD